MFQLKLCILWLMVYTAFCLKLTVFEIGKPILVEGDSTHLLCQYDLQGEQLYSVKWYKDDHEFYRFVPGESSEVQFFPVDGVHVDEKRVTNGSLFLRKLEPVSSGIYMCEVSTETPFEILSNHSRLTVLPSERPYILKSKNLPELTDIFSVNCTPRQCTDKISIFLSVSFFIVLFEYNKK
ncbi:Immunoglobulin V-set domain,Immunoglobulin subtype,Immunoglobulin-like domain,Immunoglobulin-like [Cinara cedri]|uniref:Immunoglobulin V-set domain,Immunoglobulin subtype,Immunoglobulin-like domain,Immunoglobulin-like n=1 Tax=Cinara cedri TaxID=506608 RepID=A0A5E4MBY0_9HEMI|nr:Immunoglobulin V-set domain,Immunoglobulin subtype,Immunoglobulin-like domain,Immunoglobulin-like [Cinara cedri]